MRKTSAPETREPEEYEGPNDLVEIDFVPRTELGRLAVAARRAYFASGGHPLTQEEFEHEVTERRGGTHLLDIE